VTHLGATDLSITVQDAPRIEVDLVHDAATVRLGLDAEDALRALVLHETQGIVCGVRIEELVAILGDVGEVTVPYQEREGLVEEEVNLLGLEDVLRFQNVTEGVLDPEPLHGLSQVIDTQRALGVRCCRELGCGGEAHGHPWCDASHRVDVWSLRHTLVDVAGGRGRNAFPNAGISFHHHGVKCRLCSKVYLLQRPIAPFS
jgi:hypothetical protein